MAIYKDPDYMRKWRAANKDHILASRKIYYQANKERTKQEATEWCKAHRDRSRLSARAAAANRYYPGTLTIRDVLAVIEKCGRSCYWCGKQNLEGYDLTLEHLKPINTPSCIVVACRSCNSARLHKKHRGEV